MLRLLVVAGILGGAIMIAAMLVQIRPEPAKKDTEIPDPLVDVLVLESLTENFEVRSQGTVQPRTETVLSAEVSGTVTSISPMFIAGGVFDRNEVLMRIDPTNYEVAVRQAEALVRQRAIEHDGAAKLRSQGYRAEAEYASAVAALVSAEAELVRAKRNLERTYIRLPYEGMVRAKESDLGQFVNPGTRLGVVFATDFAEVRLPLTDLDLAFLELPSAAALQAKGDAQGPEVTLSATQKGRVNQWQARIVRSEGVVDEKSRVTYAVARIEDPYRRHMEGSPLPIGTFVAAVIDGKSAEGVIRVPRGAVRGSNELLFVTEQNEVEIRSVTIIRSDAEFSYVGGGAESGERIVTSAIEAPIRGMKVRVAGEAETSDVEETAADAAGEAT